MLNTRHKENRLLDVLPVESQYSRPAAQSLCIAHVPGTRVVGCTVVALVAMVEAVVACIVVACIVEVAGLTTVITPAIPVCFSQK